MHIKGIKSAGTWDVTEERKYSLDEIGVLLKGGKHSAFLVVKKYSINGTPFFGSGFTLWDETHAPVLREGKLVLSTYFRRAELGHAGGAGDPSDLIPAEVEIEPYEPILYISIHRVHVAPLPYEEISS